MVADKNKMSESLKNLNIAHLTADNVYHLLAFYKHAYKLAYEFLFSWREIYAIGEKKQNSTLQDWGSIWTIVSSASNAWDGRVN